MTTNYERIKNMTVEEMAEFLDWFSDDKTVIYSPDNGYLPKHKVCIEQWLQQESEE